MDTLIKADIFFFITSIAVVLVTIGLLIGMYHIVTAVKRIEKFVDSAQSNMKEAGEEVKEIGEEIRNSFLFHFLFRKKQKSRKEKNN